MAGRFEGPVGREAPHPDDEITVYHTTSAEHAEHLRQHGTVTPKPRRDPRPIDNPEMLGMKVGDTYDFEPGRGLGDGLYVTRHPGEGHLYGTHSLPVRIKARDLAVPPERADHEAPRGQMTPWHALNAQDGYVPGPLSPHQFGEVYTREDHQHWDNQHG